ncbi:hypothetical protein F5882DRAFT_460694 [Hyaloscypha sp. PMI_1271]|nr:hypothetical protein F5882DRAFT_460694 [Hyaloscypha sp. PMI_1271]
MSDQRLIWADDEYSLLIKQPPEKVSYYTNVRLPVMPANLRGLGLPNRRRVSIGLPIKPAKSPKESQWTYVSPPARYDWSVPELGFFLLLHPLIAEARHYAANSQTPGHCEDLRLALPWPTTLGADSISKLKWRSTWDFLQDFYLRVEVAESYARKLEKDLYDAQTAVHQYQAVLAEYEASLVASWETLNQERLDHRACREALTFETERHKETIELLDRIFKEAIRSSEVTDILSSRLATAPNLEAWQAVPKLEGSLAETSLTRKTLTETGTFTSSHQLGKHERQQHNCASSAYGFSSTTTRSQKVSGGTGSVQVTESENAPQNGKRESSLRKFPGTT